jgi:hypothetical protein
MELDVKGVMQIIVTGEERLDICLLYARRNMGCGLRGACGACA